MDGGGCLLQQEIQQHVAGRVLEVTKLAVFQRAMNTKVQPIQNIKHIHTHNFVKIHHYIDVSMKDSSLLSLTADIYGNKQSDAAALGARDVTFITPVSESSSVSSSGCSPVVKRNKQQLALAL